MDKKIDIQKFLPHRSPMLMVDTVLTISPEQVTTSFRIPNNCVLVRGSHLGEEGLLENMAQSGSAIVGQDFFAKDDHNGHGSELIGFISTLKNVKILTLPQVGQLIETQASLVARVDTGDFTMCTLDVHSTASQKRLASCTIQIIIREVS